MRNQLHGYEMVLKPSTLLLTPSFRFFHRTPCWVGSLPITTGGVVNLNGRKLCPRIILMTDGKPTGGIGQDSEQVRKFDLVTKI